MKEQLDDYSIREKDLWFELIVDITVALFYWPQAFRLMAAGDGAMRGDAMVGLITSTVVIAIVVSTLLSIFLHTQQKPEPMDERDYMIAARSSLLASRVLVVCLFALIGHLVMSEFSSDTIPGIQWMGYLPDISPLVIAHLLLVAIMARSFTGTVARLYFYRKGL
jgi:hypothetical protein